MNELINVINTFKYSFCVFFPEFTVSDLQGTITETEKSELRSAFNALLSLLAPKEKNVSISLHYLIERIFSENFLAVNQVNRNTNSNGSKYKCFSLQGQIKSLLIMLTHMLDLDNLKESMSPWCLFRVPFVLSCAVFVFVILLNYSNTWVSVP